MKIDEILSELRNNHNNVDMIRFYEGFMDLLEERQMEFTKPENIFSRKVKEISHRTGSLLWTK